MLLLFHFTGTTIHPFNSIFIHRLFSVVLYCILWCVQKMQRVICGVYTTTHMPGIGSSTGQRGCFTSRRDSSGALGAVSCFGTTQEEQPLMRTRTSHHHLSLVVVVVEADKRVVLGESSFYGPLPVEEEEQQPQQHYRPHCWVDGVD